MGSHEQYALIEPSQPKPKPEPRARVSDDTILEMLERQGHRIAVTAELCRVDHSRVKRVAIENSIEIRPQGKNERGRKVGLS